MGLLTRKVQAIIGGLRNTERVLGIVGACLLFLMMAIGFVDVAGRYLFNSPITGGLEITKTFMMGMVVLSWAATQAARGHIRVDFVVIRFSPRVQAILIFAGDLISLVFFSLIAWQAAETGIVCWERNELMAIIDFPLAILHFAASLGACFICLELIVQLGSFVFGAKGVEAKA